MGEPGLPSPEVVQGLIDFWLTRLEEDAAAARQSRSILLIVNTSRVRVGTDEEVTYRHFDRWGPERVLMRCANERAMFEETIRPFLSSRRDDTPARVAWLALRLLASEYAGWREFRPEWRV